MSKYSPTSSRSTAGAKGRNDSRYLTLRFSVFCIEGERASPRIERAPSARGPNSMRPCIQPTAFSSASACAVCSIVCSRVEARELATGRRQALGDLVVGIFRSEIAAGHAVEMAVELARLAEIAVIGGVGRADRAAGIAGRRLHPDAVEQVLAQQLAVGDAVQRHAAGQADVLGAGLLLHRARQPQHDLLGDGLHRGREVHVVLGQKLFGLARLAAEQRAELLVRHAQPGAIVEVGLVEAEGAVFLEVDDVVRGSCP